MRRASSRGQVAVPTRNPGEASAQGCPRDDESAGIAPLFEQQRTTGSPGSRASDVKTGCHLPRNPVDGAPRTTSGGPGRRPPIPRERAARRPPRTDERACCPPMMLRLLATATAATALLFSPTPGVLVLSPALTGPRTTYIRQRVNQIVAARLESWPPRHRRGASSMARRRGLSPLDSASTAAFPTH